jgi:hypothetical protein
MILLQRYKYDTLVGVTFVGIEKFRMTSTILNQDRESQIKVSYCSLLKLVSLAVLVSEASHSFKIWLFVLLVKHVLVVAKVKQ